ncbi:hypothetical protein MIN45_P2042 [Methylomarinovum tepidoasis]|uniref:Lipoprotein n=1 Tax=Methylomarinovum tepidoasis TaxID=2840183 RepID=A0AAU9D031_9GAMM|nr:hypothetical protein [Methylomarinovum sp. IN45]BCX89669.1 hypothetical protein MIN45_P2042 [Methylomarinovum sp. IN45]
MRPSHLAPVCLFIMVLLLAACTGTVQETPPPLTIPQIIALSRQGESASEIIARIRASHTLYRLLPNQIERLRREGVPEAVIDYIQRQYRQAVRRYPELNDWESWILYEGYWYATPDGGADVWLEE